MQLARVPASYFWWLRICQGGACMQSWRGQPPATVWRVRICHQQGIRVSKVHSALSLIQATDQHHVVSDSGIFRICFTFQGVQGPRMDGIVLFCKIGMKLSSSLSLSNDHGKGSHSGSRCTWERRTIWRGVMGMSTGSMVTTWPDSCTVL